MATYDYSCKTCGLQFEHVQSMKDDALTECLCEKKGTVERMITSTAGIIFKGTGFYVTDYKKDNSKPAAVTAEAPVTAELPSVPVATTATAEAPKTTTPTATNTTNTNV